MKIINFPEFRQTYSWDCGAKVLHAVLVYYGFDPREEEIIKKSGMTRGGMKVTEMKQCARKYGLKAMSKKMTIEDIKKYIDKKIPVIIPLQAWTDSKKINWEKNWIDGHYVVAIGYDKNKIYFEDPSVSHRNYLTYVEFLKRWHDQDRDGKRYINCGIIIYGKKPNYKPVKAIPME